jgi:hypothetical protein
MASWGRAVLQPRHSSCRLGVNYGFGAENALGLAVDGEYCRLELLHASAAVACRTVMFETSQTACPNQIETLETSQYTVVWSRLAVLALRPPTTPFLVHRLGTTEPVAFIMTLNSTYSTHSSQFQSRNSVLAACN